MLGFRRASARLLPALTALIICAGCAHKDSVVSPNLDAGDTVATVGDQPITQAEFYTQLQNFDPQSTPSTGSAGRTVLEKLINAKVVLELAQQEGVLPTSAQVDQYYQGFAGLQESQSVKPFAQSLADIGLTVDDFKNELLKPQLAQFFLVTKDSLPPTDKEMQTYYDKHKVDRFSEPARARIKVISLADQTDANQIDKLIKGGKPFDSFLPRSISTQFDNGDFPQWVGLDPATDIEFVPVINAIKQLKPGDTSGPFLFKGLWWIVQVVDERPATVVSFADARPIVAYEMLLDKVQQTQTQNPQQIEAVETEQRDLTVKMAQADQIKISLQQQQYQQLLAAMKNPPPPPPSQMAPPSGAPAPSSQQGAH